MTGQQITYRKILDVTNSDTGRQLFKADLVALANQYQSIDAISNFKIGRAHV